MRRLSDARSRSSLSRSDESDAQPANRDGPSQAGFAACFGRSLASLGITTGNVELTDRRHPTFVLVTLLGIVLSWIGPMWLRACGALLFVFAYVRYGPNPWDRGKLIPALVLLIVAMSGLYFEQALQAGTETADALLQAFVNSSVAAVFWVLVFWVLKRVSSRISRRRNV
jgi:H+/Cl- antiporter ClcA